MFDVSTLEKPIDLYNGPASLHVADETVDGIDDSGSTRVPIRR